MTDNTLSSMWTAAGPGWGEGADRKIIKLCIDCRKRFVSVNNPISKWKRSKKGYEDRGHSTCSLHFAMPPRLSKLGSSRSTEMNCWQKAEHRVTKHCSFRADRTLITSRKGQFSNNWNTKGLKNYGDRNPPNEQNTMNWNRKKSGM